jgi:uncharacterized protein YkwD
MAMPTGFRCLFSLFCCAAALVSGLRATVEDSRPALAATPAPPLADFQAGEFAAALLAETNRVRREHGRRPLRRRAELERAADDQAGFMAVMRRAQHASAIRGQETPGDRVRRRGLDPQKVSENVAAYPIVSEKKLDTPEELAAMLVAEWMASPPHRANLLSRDFTDFGGSVRFAPLIARVWAAYAVQVFSAGQSPRVGGF